MPQKSDAIAIVTVHGTGDTAATAVGEKWFQQGSKFAQRLLDRLRGQGVAAEIVPHLWSGANSASDRERAADKLADRVRRLHKHYAGVHVIGHSHGGNVANDAAVLLKWGLRKNAKKERMDSLTTVGTPFFNYRTGPLQFFAGLLFNVLTWGAAITFVPTALALIYYTFLASAAATPEDEMIEKVLTIAYIAIMAPCLWFMFHMSVQGVRRILRPRTGGKTSTSVFSIWHQNDEAIAFLQRIEELQLEPFPRGAFMRGSRGGAISLGVLVVILTSIAVPVLFAFGFDFLNIGALLAPTEAEPVVPAALENDVAYLMGVVVGVVILGLWVAPPLFTAIYLLIRYIAGGATEICARGSANRYVVGILRGIAMGRDGDQILCHVGPCSHTHATEQHVLSGECAARMQEGANGAAGRLIDKYRWALFAVGGESGASLSALTTDAMTWDSLIHTTYFDQPEVSDMIGDFIARKAREKAAAVSGAPAPEASASGLPAMA